MSELFKAKQLAETMLVILLVLVCAILINSLLISEGILWHLNRELF